MDYILASQKREVLMRYVNIGDILRVHQQHQIYIEGEITTITRRGANIKTSNGFLFVKWWNVMTVYKSKDESTLDVNKMVLKKRVQECAPTMTHSTIDPAMLHAAYYNAWSSSSNTKLQIRVPVNLPIGNIPTPDPITTVTIGGVSFPVASCSYTWNIKPES